MKTKIVKNQEDLELKRITFEIKAEGDAGQFVGIASVYGIEDLGGDVIEPGAFTKTLNERPEVPVLFQHRPEIVIGSGQVKDTGTQIEISGQLDMEDPAAQNVFRKLKKSLIKGLSIGYQAIKVTWEETETKYIRHITELKLWEVSIVTFPMLPEAQVTAVKFRDGNETLDGAVAELKAGRAISKDRADRLRGIANEILALLDEAGASEDATTSDGAAKQQGIEPAIDHSELVRSLSQLQGDLQWTRN